jgi:hypothetical protein
MKENFKFLISLLTILLLFSVFISREKINEFVSSLYSEIKISFEELLASPGISQEIEVIGDGGFGNSITQDNSQNIAVSFLNGKGELIFAKKVKNSWQKEIVDSQAQAGHKTSLAFSKDGRANILYIDKDFSLKIATKQNRSWKKEQIAGSAALSCSLIFDKNNTPHISFWDPNKGGLKYGRYVVYDEIGKWKIETVDAGEVGWWNDLVLDESQKPHISYFDFKNKDLLYVFFNGKNWHKEIVDFERDVGRFNSITLDKDDQPHLSYFDEEKSDLKYAKKGEGGWEIETVTKNGTVGERTNIVVDQNGNPLISYFDLSNGDFKLAKKNENQEWETKIIDSKGETGGDNSVFIDKENKLNLVWQDLTQGKLKYTTYP